MRQCTELSNHACGAFTPDFVVELRQGGRALAPIDDIVHQNCGDDDAYGQPNHLVNNRKC